MNEITQLRLVVKKGIEVSTSLINSPPGTLLGLFEANDLMDSRDQYTTISNNLVSILEDFISIRNRLVQLGQYNLNEEIVKMGQLPREEVQSSLDQVPCTNMQDEDS